MEVGGEVKVGREGRVGEWEGEEVGWGKVGV
jgi:hypothetical protein